MSMTKATSLALVEHFTVILRSGGLPEVEYAEFTMPNTTRTNYSFNLFPYNERLAAFSKIAHERLVAMGYERGIFTNMRSKAYLGDIAKACAEITAENVRNCPNRFRTALG